MNKLSELTIEDGYVWAICIQVGLAHKTLGRLYKNPIGIWSSFASAKKTLDKEGSPYEILWEWDESPLTLEGRIVAHVATFSVHYPPMTDWEMPAKNIRYGVFIYKLKELKE